MSRRTQTLSISQPILPLFLSLSTKWHTWTHTDKKTETLSLSHKHTRTSFQYNSNSTYYKMPFWWFQQYYTNNHFQYTEVIATNYCVEWMAQKHPLLYFPWRELKLGQRVDNSYNYMWCDVNKAGVSSFENSTMTFTGSLSHEIYMTLNTICQTARQG